VSTVSRARRPRRRRRIWSRLALAAALGIAFVAGIGLGEALHDRPRPGGTQTLVRTLEPLHVAPVPAETGTVTTSGP
jgi:hypothetical protein